jgi:tetratricopeptide (TPR) repeat protein
VPSAKTFALVLGVALAASVTSLRNGFVYDDVPVVVENRALHTLEGLPGILTSAYWPQDVRDRIYRPATLASFAVDWAVGGGRPLVFHATNVLLHLAVVALVLGLCASVLGPGAVVAGLWFAVHPVHVEAIANVVGRSELLAAAGYLAATLAFVAHGRSVRAAPAALPRIGWAALALLSSLLAFGAKEHALSLPAALLLADGWAARGDGEAFGVRFRRHAPLWMAVVGLTVAYLVLRASVLGTAVGGGTVAEGLGGLSAPQRAVAILPLVLVWARLLAFPLHLSPDYAPAQFVPETTMGFWHVAALAVLLAVLAGAWRARRRSPALLFGVAWFAVTAVIGSNLLVPTGVVFAERLLYLPSVGAALAVGALWEMLPPWRAVWPLTVLGLGLLGTRTLERIPVWQTPDSFFASRARDAVRSYKTHWQLGDRAFERGDARAGERELLEAVRIYPKDAALLEDLGSRYLSAGVDRPADRFSTAAYLLDPTRSAAAARAVIARLRAGAVDSARALAREAARRFPSDEAVLLAAIAVFERMGDTRRVLALARQLTYVDPRSAASQLIAGDAARRVGLCGEAADRLAKALALAADEAQRAEIRRRQAALAACRGAR